MAISSLLRRRRASSVGRALVAEAGVALDADELVALVEVLDVDDPEAAGAELGGLGPADRLQDLAGAQQVAGAHRLVEDDRVVAHDRLGQVEALLEVEVHLEGQALARGPGDQWWGRNHSRQQRGHGDGAAGDGVGDLVVPEQRVAVLDRRRAGPRVAPLDGEVADRVVLGDADQGDDVVGQLVDGRSRCCGRRRLMRPLLRCAGRRWRRRRGRRRPAARRCRCGRCRGPRSVGASVSVPASSGAELAELAGGLVGGLGEDAAGGEVGVVDQLGHGVDGRDAGVGRGQLGDPLVAGAGGEHGGEVGADLRPARRRPSGGRPTARSRAGGTGCGRSWPRWRRRRPTCRRRSGRCRSRRSGR